jgi:hypothetical protein
MKSSGLVRGTMIATMVSLALACSNGSDSTATDVVDDTTADSPAPAVTEAPVTEAPVTEAPAPSWETIVAPADCMCADGSPYSYYVREADPTKVMFYMEGGGACFSGPMCAPDSTTYKKVIDPAPGDDATGIFDFDNPDNPFADYSFVYVPYCTGDVHSGNLTKDYGGGVVVQHKGFVNASAAMNTLVERFPEASNVVVAGSSAGAFTTPIFAGLVADELDGASVSVIADSGGAIPDAISVVTANWGTVESLPDWPEFADATPATITPAYSFVKVATHNPSIRFLRHDFAFDNVLSSFARMAGISPDGLVDVMRTGEATIEETGVPVAAWVSPGDAHTILWRADLYNEEVNGVRFLDWLLAFLDGTPLDDNYCVDCAG